MVAASLLHSGQGAGERERGRGRLGEEWRALEEQRSHFEKERRNFTEAAIRLSHEVGGKRREQVLLSVLSVGKCVCSRNCCCCCCCCGC